jgi:hypothetical protein
MSPAESRTISPGTSCSIGISLKPWDWSSPAGIAAPRRLTLAVVFTMARSFAAASLERCSWMNAVVIARITMTPMTIAARMSPRK